MAPRMYTQKPLLMSTAVLALFATPALAAPKVVASIPPIHSVVAGVMEGVGAPELLVPGGASPHTYAMRPSEARALSEADVVFWVGEQIETFLQDPLHAVADQATVVELVDTPGVTLLPIREGGVFEEHDHDHGAEAAHADEHGHGHDAAHEEHAAAEADHDDHDHDADHKEHAAAQADHDDHDHDEDHHEHTAAEASHDDHDHDADHKEHAEAEAGHDDHDHGSVDAHIWLSIGNVEHMVDTVVATLSAQDPANAGIYAANGEKMHGRLHELEETLGAQLSPVHDRPYIVFHDAYQYVEVEHELRIAGSITVDPDQRPGARRMAELRERVVELDAVCVFSEPQFPPDLVTTIVEGTDAKSAVLDPLGAGLTPGPDLYFDLMEGMGATFAACLAETG